MYWQKRFDRTNKDADLEEKIIDIRANHKQKEGTKISPKAQTTSYKL